MATPDDYKAEVLKLMEEWRNVQDDVVPFLTRLAERFEKEAEEFHKQDPDPFDDRHPVYTTPSSAFGKLLKALTKQEEFLDALVNKYLKCRSRSLTDLENSDGKPSLPVAAARVLLAIIPGLDSQSIFTNSADILPLLYRWAMDGSETLRTYATGILASAVENQDINAQYTNENSALVPVLLKRLWNYIEPGKYSSEKSDALPVANAKVVAGSIENEPTNDHNITKDISTELQTCASSASTKSISKKRRYSGDISKKVKLRKTDEMLNALTKAKEALDRNKQPLNKLHTKRKDNFINLPTTSEIADINEVSNSSWAEMMPVVIGCTYSLAPPLIPTICERYILNLLIPLGEYQDLLSHFLEYGAIDLVNHYLEHSNTNDGLLTFSALRFFASLLCHNKIATAFIEDKGIPKLLSVMRPSIGATGVSLCIYYLACIQHAMELVCELPHKLLSDLVKYATWLLECSHDSGRCHAALFFSISFQFRIILKLFDQQNGIRCLLNILSTLPIIRLEEDGSIKENEETFRQTARTICTALRKYFETHLIIKATVVKEALQVNQSNAVLQHSSSKVIECDRENIWEYLDFLLNLGQQHTTTVLLPSASLTNWIPIQNFVKLDGIPLLLRLIRLAFDWTNYGGRADTIRFALDSLAVVTLSPKAQLLLCQPVNLPSSCPEATGISIVLSVAEGEAYVGIDPDAQKSALSIIINCVCGPQYEVDGAMAKVVLGTPVVKLISKSMDERQEKLWESIKTNNGIKILIQLLITTQPEVHADDIRLLACKALCGLSRCESVKQIISKLPMFNNGQLQALTRQRVRQDRRRQHVKFCKYVEELTERISGKPNAMQMDMDGLRKAHIVSQTMIRYDNREVLQLIHSHLAWSGLHSTASMLAREASLYIPTTSSTSVLSTPSNTLRIPGPSGDASYISPHNRRISFSRGAHAHGETPTLQPHSSLICTPNQKKSKIKFKVEAGTSGEMIANSSHSYHLSSTGRITVVEPRLLDTMEESRNGAAGSPTSLNTIVAEYLKNQHSHCKNPVVTVPEFSLLRPHYCPEPRFRVEAPLNIASRCMRRQVAPRCGGLGGAACDRQFIYSRFRPSIVFRSADEDNVPYTCCAFTPDDTSVILGSYQGDLTIHNILVEKEGRVLENVGDAPIVKIEPARDGKRLLFVEQGILREKCSLFSLDSMAVELSYPDIYYAEFSKTIQDKVVGTITSSTVILDLQTGQKIRSFDRPDLASQYTPNRATFSPDDELILSDGHLWDLRSNAKRPIHKFDKFNSSISGVFHPRGLEVIINSEIWDLRNYHLLHTVPTIDQCTISFNADGTIMYAAKSVTNHDIEDIDDEEVEMGSTTFQAIDANDYRSVSVTDTKHKIYDFAADRSDSYVAVIERQQAQLEWDGLSMSICRLYEVGRVRGEDEEDEQDDDNIVDGNDDDDDDDNDNNGNGVNSDDSSESGSGSSYDIPSFAISLSSGDSDGRRTRRRTRRRRGLPSFSDSDGWSTLDEGSSGSDDDDFANLLG